MVGHRLLLGRHRLSGGSRPAVAGCRPDAAPRRHRARRLRHPLPARGSKPRRAPTGRASPRPWPPLRAKRRGPIRRPGPPAGREHHVGRRSPSARSPAAAGWRPLGPRRARRAVRSAPRIPDGAPLVPADRLPVASAASRRPDRRASMGRRPLSDGPHPSCPSACPRSARARSRPHTASGERRARADQTRLEKRRALRLVSIFCPAPPCPDPPCSAPPSGPGPTSGPGRASAPRCRRFCGARSRPRPIGLPGGHGRPPPAGPPRQPHASSPVRPPSIGHRGARRTAVDRLNARDLLTARDPRTPIGCLTGGDRPIPIDRPIQAGPFRQIVRYRRIARPGPDALRSLVPGLGRLARSSCLAMRRRGGPSHLRGEPGRVAGRLVEAPPSGRPGDLPGHHGPAPDRCALRDRPPGSRASSQDTGYRSSLRCPVRTGTPARCAHHRRGRR